MLATVRSLYRYPIKGLNGQSLETAPIRPGAPLPFDRAFALARPEGAYRPDGRLYAKTEFYTLVRHERLAGLHASMAEDGTLVVSVSGGRAVLRANLLTAAGRAEASRFFGRVLDTERALPVIAHVPGVSFTDMAETGRDGMALMSVINLESVRDLAERIGAEVDPLRFRGNVLWDGLAPFEELDLVGSEIQMDGVRFEVVEPTARCAATEVDPRNGRRDLRIPRLMMQTYGHAFMGVYLRALDDGVVSVGAAVDFVGRSAA